MDNEIAKALNSLSRKINEVNAKLDEYINMVHAESTESIDITTSGVLELAELVSGLEEKVNG